MTTTTTMEEQHSMIVIVKDLAHDDDQHDEESQALVMRPSSSEEEEQRLLLVDQHPPLHFNLALKASKSEDDHTDDTCEVSSRSSCHTHEDLTTEVRPHHPHSHIQQPNAKDDSTAKMPEWMHDLMWLAICFFGIMISFVAYGILLEYATSGERRLHERTSAKTTLSFPMIPGDFEAI
jgi:hypothetical protein